ncbi:MAG: site-specific integrase, partial [Candidatus Acidiferrales bacterium]
MPTATTDTIAASTEKFLHYLRYVRNASPKTIASYKIDLDQFIAYVTPPGEQALALRAVDRLVIREFISHLYEQHMQKSSVARKLAALRSFFRFCVREHLTEQNPARLVARPKLPQRLPNVMSAEEMNRLLDDMTQARTAQARPNESKNKSAPPSKPIRANKSAALVLARDRAILELLYASGLRVSELTGLDMTSINS